MQNVAVVLVNYNSEKETMDCIDSLLKSDTGDNALEIIIIDNHSEAKSREYIATHLPKTHNSFTITYVQREKNTGFSGGYNHGMRLAINHGADVVIVLNNDTIVDRNLIRSLLEGAEDHPDAGLIVPKIYFAGGYEFHKERYKESERGKVIWYAGGEIDWDNVIGKHRGVDEVDHGQYDREGEVAFASGCCFLVKRETVQKIGYFDDRYFLYFEDADFSERIKKIGAVLYYPKAFLWHKNAGSTGGSGSSLQDYYMTRNRLLFGFTYAPIRARFALFRLALRLLRTGRQWEKKGVQDFFLRKFGQGSYHSL